METFHLAEAKPCNQPRPGVTISRWPIPHSTRATLSRYRDRDGVEVDIVIERGARALAGVEIKAGASVNAVDFRGLRKLKETAGKRFTGGVVLYGGETMAGFGDGLWAVPLRTLWELE